MTKAQILGHIDEWHVSGDNDQHECDWVHDCGLLDLHERAQEIAVVSNRSVEKSLRDLIAGVVDIEGAT